MLSFKRRAINDVFNFPAPVGFLNPTGAGK
jgi:hypothetical protein